MLFLKAFGIIFLSKFWNIVLVLGFIFICIWAYNKSIKSRRYYKCPQCGESFRMEHSQARCCKVCGAELEEISDINVNDSAK